MASLSMSSANFHLSQNFGVPKPDWLNQELSTGTSIIAVEYKDGVVLGADSRTSLGAYVACNFTNKLTPVTDSIFCCRSGSAADTQAVADIVKYYLSIYRMQMEQEPSVHTAANVFRDICYGYRDQLTAGIIVAGWDKENGGQVYRVPVGGSMIKQRLALGGSGSTYIFGYVDSKFKENMSKNEALQFCADSLALAMMRDGGSGGLVNLVAISEQGVEPHMLTGENIPKFYQG
ncbi:proteasome subunit beta type-6-like [Watersipora subatra]|uniref:proteasome subunit beta type-6-like n=1 Tax=Watersipora subatra TaxID=2589382 RepID=UPI00355BF63C